MLIVCPNEQHLKRVKATVQSAGFRTISARTLDDAWAKTYSFAFNAVVIDYELKNDIAALRSRSGSSD